MSADHIAMLEGAARDLRRESNRIAAEAASLERAARAIRQAAFDDVPILDPPTPEEIAAARVRLAPYLGENPYPQPMIDTRYIRIAERVATIEERREVAAERVVWKEAGR